MKWEHRDRMTAAWHAGVIGRAKTVPPLQKLLGDEKPRQVQSPQDMLAAMKSMVRER